jgi:hypothetical protein
METITAAKAMEQLASYGALGLCLCLALFAIVILDRDRTRIRKRLEEEQQGRVDDAKAYLDMALELQRAESEKLTKLATIAETLRAGRGGGSLSE